MDVKSAELLCKCRVCPSFPESADQTAFCCSPTDRTYGATSEYGCECSDCAVERDRGFTHDYYCTRGSEKHQLASG